MWDGVMLFFMWFGMMVFIIMVMLSVLVAGVTIRDAIEQVQQTRAQAQKAALLREVEAVAATAWNEGETYV